VNEAFHEPFEKVTREASEGGVPGEETSPLVGEEDEECPEGRRGVEARLRVRGRGEGGEGPDGREGTVEPREDERAVFLEEGRGDKVGKHADFTTQKERRASGGRTHATKRP